MREPVMIVGAGLSGLYAASLLTAKGISHHVLEARGRIGGRVLSKELADRPEIGMFDLGPTWFWPQYEPVITNLVEAFGLKTIVQQTEGAVLIEQSQHGPIQRGMLPEGAAPESVRLAGGVQALIDTIADELPTGTIELNTRVTAIHMNETGEMTLDTVHADGEEKKVQAGTVIMALPTRLAANKISFSPSLSSELIASLLDKPTWMAEQAKAVAVYEHPFWLDDGLSGQAMSWGGGPLQEIHDASPGTGYGALFGFFGMPADKRQQLGKENVQEQVIEQLTRLFGASAKKPIAFLYKDWAADSDTAVDVDTESPGVFPDYGRPTNPDAWENKMVFSGTETSAKHGGHLEGALQSAQRAVSDILKVGGTGL